MIVPMPRNAIASVKFSDTSVSVQLVIEMSGVTKTLHPYAAPRQICMTTAATAMSHLLEVMRALPGRKRITASDGIEFTPKRAGFAERLGLNRQRPLDEILRWRLDDGSAAALACPRTCPRASR